MSTGMPAGSSAASGSNRRLQQTQNQVDEVVDIMRVNVDKVLERDQKLSELDDRADALQAGASQFETSAAKLKRKYWWKNCKMWAIGISVVVIIIIIIIVLPLYTVLKQPTAWELSKETCFESSDSLLSPSAQCGEATDGKSTKAQFCSHLD
ncbi:vesicle-associated membrane protein 3 isoform 1-T1 [Hipposideros larvatus]